MKKNSCRILAFILAIVTMALPAAGFAEDYDMAKLTVDNFRLTVGESSLDLNTTLQLTAGINEVMDRGMLVADAYGGNTSALQILLALEDAKIKGYMQNASGGLSHLIEIPVEDLQALIASEADADFKLDQVTPMLNGLVAGLGSSSGSATIKDLAEEFKRVAVEKFGMEETGSERITLFDQTLDAEVSEVTLNLAQYLALVDEVAQSDEALRLLWQSVGTLLEQQSGKTIADLPELLKAEGVEAIITTRLFACGENAGRITAEFLISNENEQMPISLIVDYNAEEGNNAISAELNVAVPGEGKASMYAEKYDVATEDALDGYVAAGLSVTAGDIENVVEFSMKKHGTEAAGVVTGGSIDDIIGKQAGNQGAATDSATIHIKAVIPEEQLDISLGIQYDGTHYNQEGDVVYYGSVTVDATQDNERLGTSSFNTEYRLSHMPEGVLLSSEGIGVIDPLSADEASLVQLQESAMAILQNALSVAKQTPGLNSFFTEE